MLFRIDFPIRYKVDSDNKVLYYVSLDTSFNFGSGRCVLSILGLGFTYLRDM